MVKRTNHVIPSASRWAVRKFGAAKASRSFGTKDAAVEYGRELSKKEKTELYIHQSNGMVQEKFSYSNDLNSSKEKS